ncbi:preprotein translocase subunit YajC [Planctomycetota bacterium]
MFVLAAQGAGAGGGSWTNTMMLMIPLFVIMYVIMIRPQKIKDKERKAMLSKLTKNDRVVTIGGIHGTIANVKDKEIVLKVDESNNLKLRFARSAIARILTNQEESNENEE